MNKRQEFLARELGHIFATGTLRKGTEGYVQPGFMAQMQAAFTQPFSKHPYDPSFGAAPGYLDSQINRALNRDGESPNDIQAQINTTTSRPVGTETTAAAGAEPAGFGGSGDSGTIGRQLGHTGQVGETTLAAPSGPAPIVMQPSAPLLPPMGQAQSAVGTPPATPPVQTVQPLQPPQPQQ